MKRKKLQWKYLLVLVGLTVLVLLVRDFNNRMVELRRLSIEKERVAATVTDMVATRSSLETQIAMATSDILYEEIAREQMKYSDPDDHPIILVEGTGDQEDPIQVIVPVIEPVERWELWLALFIDPKPADNSP